MSRITKRLISTVNFLNNTYASKPIVKAYVTKRLKEECDVKGHDAKGAEYADVPGGAHPGGKYKDEPFHLTYLVKKKDGTKLGCTDPRTKKQTYRHHFYIAQSKETLESEAKIWHAAQQAKKK